MSSLCKPPLVNAQKGAGEGGGRRRRAQKRDPRCERAEDGHGAYPSSDAMNMDHASRQKTPASKHRFLNIARKERRAGGAGGRGAGPGSSSAALWRVARTPVREDQADDEERVVPHRAIDRLHHEVRELGRRRHDPRRHAVRGQPSVRADQRHHVARLSRGAGRWQRSGGSGGNGAGAGAWAGGAPRSRASRTAARSCAAAAALGTGSCRPTRAAGTR